MTIRSSCAIPPFRIGIQQLLIDKGLLPARQASIVALGDILVVWVLQVSHNFVQSTTRSFCLRCHCDHRVKWGPDAPVIGCWARLLTPSSMLFLCVQSERRIHVSRWTFCLVHCTTRRPGSSQICWQNWSILSEMKTICVCCLLAPVFPALVWSRSVARNEEPGNDVRVPVVWRTGSEHFVSITWFKMPCGKVRTFQGKISYNFLFLVMFIEVHWHLDPLPSPDLCFMPILLLNFVRGTCSRRSQLVASRVTWGHTSRDALVRLYVRSFCSRSWHVVVTLATFLYGIIVLPWKPASGYSIQYPYPPPPPPLSRNRVLLYPEEILTQTRCPEEFQLTVRKIVLTPRIFIFYTGSPRAFCNGNLQG